MIDYSFSIAELEYFLLIFTRVTCFISVAPFYGMNNTPLRVKIGLGFFTSLLIHTATMPHEALVYHTVLSYAAIVLKEAATGLLVGYGANICTMIISFAGHIVDMESGLSMASLMDPTTREQTSISGVFYQYIIMLILLVSGMYRYILGALIDTFELIPVNGAIFRADSLLNAMLQFMSDYIIIGFRICLPVFVAMLLLNVVLGILAKVSPQMNMFSVGMQLKILVGFSVIFLTVGMIPDAASFIFDEMKKMMVAFVEGMM